MFHDYQDPRDRLDHVMVSTTVENCDTLLKSQAVSILLSTLSKLQQNIASQIRKCCAEYGVLSCEIVDIKEISPGMLNHRSCMSLLEMEVFLLLDVESEIF